MIMDYKKKYKESMAKMSTFLAKHDGFTISKDGEMYKDLSEIFPELKESEDERIRMSLIELFKDMEWDDSILHDYNMDKDKTIAWLEKQGGGQNLILPKWKYKKDNTPLLRDSIILNKYGCVAKSPSGALVSDVWVMDYAELAKLPKEECEKQEEPQVYETEDGKVITYSETNGYRVEQKPAWSEEDVAMLDSAIAFVEHSAFTTTGKGKGVVVAWLKSLKDRYAWKPSDEQMTALNYVVNIMASSEKPIENDYYYNVFKDLREQLKKLKEE